MDLHLTVDLKKTKTLIDLADQAHLIIEQTTKLPKKEAVILFLLRDNQLVALGLAEEKATYKEVSFDHSILLKPTWDTELAYLAQAFLDDAKESGLTLEATPTTVKIPKSAVATVTNYKETVTFILERFGYSLFKKPAPKKARPAKARHKWTKEVSQIPFYIDTRQSKATVFWQKRNEMLIKAGATMMPEAPLNKDGSVGFSARFGEKLRDERKGQFKDFVTTEDIVLKSVNEVGLFLYFAGTNSWLELVDENGKTLNEWTVVE